MHAQILTYRAPRAPHPVLRFAMEMTGAVLCLLGLPWLLTALLYGFFGG